MISAGVAHIGCTAQALTLAAVTAASAASAALATDVPGTLTVCTTLPLCQKASAKV